MKKILFGFLAIAITLASCKDYDDEFDALNASIAALQTQVAGFSTLQSGLTTLQSSVAALQSTVNSLPAPADISGLESDFNLNPLS